MILRSGEIVELPNKFEDPANSFLMVETDYAEYKEEIVATWHTHPRTSANLSVEDYLMFKTKPDWYHYIVSETEVWCYFVKNGKVILYEDADLS